MDNILVIKDQDTVLHISYEDLIKYHGRHFIGGVAMAFKVMELAFLKLSYGEIPSREKIHIVVGVEGPGILDAFEMVTRARSRKALVVSQQVAYDKTAPDAADGKGGKYYFEFVYENRKLVLSLKADLIPKEFIKLSYKTHDGTLTEQEKVRLKNLKESIATFIMASEVESLFDYSLISV